MHSLCQLFSCFCFFLMSRKKDVGWEEGMVLFRFKKEHKYVLRGKKKGRVDMHLID